MALATRCPHCKTVFQVSEAQLKLRSGAVRCGVCQNPFNGIDNLIGRVSSQTDEPSNNPETTNLPASSDSGPMVTGQNPVNLTDQNGARPASLRQADSPTTADEEDSPDEAFIPPNDALKEAFDRQLQSLSLDLNDFPGVSNTTGTFSSSISAMPGTVENSGAEDEGVTSLSETRDISPEVAPVDRVKKGGPAESAPNVDPSLSLPLPHVGADTLPAASAIRHTPEELSRLLHQRRKKAAISRTLWAFGIILLAVVLCGQLVYRYSVQIVAWWPPAGDLVEATCEILSCPGPNPVESRPWKVEYGNLTAREGTNDQFTQHITVINKSSSPQLWPSLAVEITDVDNNLLSRKMMEPQEYLPEESGAAKGLQPHEKTDFELALEFRHDSAINSRVIVINH